MEGKAAALLSLGIGFHPDFTGTQNVRIAGRLLGLSARQIDARMDAIMDFAEIGVFAGQPMRTYSAGMVARLGFAPLSGST